MSSADSTTVLGNSRRSRNIRYTRVAELTVNEDAATLLMAVAARRALNGLPDDFWTKRKIEFYSDPSDACFKALLE